jgi:hypothetical protein
MIVELKPNLYPIREGGIFNFKERRALSPEEEKEYREMKSLNFNSYMAHAVDELTTKLKQSQDQWVKAMIIVHGGVDYIGLSDEEMAKKAVENGFRIEYEHKGPGPTDDPLSIVSVAVVRVRQNERVLGELPIKITGLIRP